MYFSNLCYFWGRRLKLLKQYAQIIYNIFKALNSIVRYAQVSTRMTWSRTYSALHLSAAEY